MIISRTPFRVSFFGGGTDYPAWYLEEGGAVLSTTINKFCYLTCRYLPPFFSIKHRIVWSHIETVDSISQILHPAVRAGLGFLDFDDSIGLEIHYQGDLPARAGMGSSSSFVVGLIKALLALRGQMVSKLDLALKAVELEQNVLKEPVGSQDQVAAAFGGLNVIRFCQNGEIQVEPLTIPRSRASDLEARLLLFYTGTSRMSSDAASDVVANLQKKGDVLRRMYSLVGQAVSVLDSRSDLDDFGRMLHETWMLKRETSETVATDLVDRIYQTGIEHGAIGGKLLGAGGRGFMLFYVPPEDRERVMQSLPGCLHVPFKFESEGSTIIHYDDDENG